MTEDFETCSGPERIEKKELYRNINAGQLYMLWRDGELPRGISRYNHKSTSTPGRLMTYWFDQPAKLELPAPSPMNLNALIQLNTEKLTENIAKGKMI